MVRGARSATLAALVLALPSASRAAPLEYLAPSPCFQALEDVRATLEALESSLSDAAVSAQGVRGFDAGFRGAAFQGWGSPRASSDPVGVSATGERAVALGGDATRAVGNFSLAAGVGSLAAGDASVALGTSASATGLGAT